MRDKEANELLASISAKLSEHFDHVQVMVTWNEERETRWGFWGAGNWYARQGLAAYFMEQDKAQEVASQLSSVLEAE